MPLALWALALSAFAIGTTEFVIVGLIPTIAASLQVSVPSAGLLVSLYALGVAIGAPLLTAMTGRVPRKQLLLGLMVLFTIGNLVAWMAPGYAALMAARVLTGLAHGVFFSIGSTIATSLVPKEKAASAIALMFTGLTVALVTGVPLGHLHRPALRLAGDVPGGVAAGRDRRYRQRHPGAVRYRRQQAGAAADATGGAEEAAPAAGVCDHDARLRRQLHRLHLPGADPAASVRLRGVDREPGDAGVWRVGRGREYLGRQAGRSSRAGARAADRVRAAGPGAAGADLHGAEQTAGADHGPGLGRGRLRQRAGPAGVCGAARRTRCAAGGRCGVGPEHRRLQCRHRAGRLGRWPDRRAPRPDGHAVDRRAGGRGRPAAHDAGRLARSPRRRACQTA